MTDLAGSPPRRDSHDGEIITDPLDEFVHVEFRAPHPDDVRSTDRMFRPGAPV